MSIPKYYSLNTKITISFTILGFLLLALLFIQIIPNMQDEQKENKRQQIEHTIDLTNQQIKLAVQLLIHQKETKKDKLELFLKTELNSTFEKINNKNKEFELEKLSKKLNCEVYTFPKNKSSFSNYKKDFILEDKLSFYTEKQEHMCPKSAKSLIYSSYLKEFNEMVVLECNPNNFRSEHSNLEEKIKKDLQKSFQLTYKDHKGKINLIWINSKHKNYDSKPLYNYLDKTYNSKYCLSKMSSSNLPQTGLLTAKQIVDATNKNPISHMLDSKEALTWVRTIGDKNDIKLLFLTTIYQEDFNRDFYSPLLKIFPAAVFSLLIALSLGFLLFKRLFKSINILTNTAKQVDEGNINLRSNIKGNNDIAILAKTFDSMLDSIEKNINELDKKVEVQTAELRNSLEEKEILLKEIHHRVKNNLAMTINLIKLQKSKIDDFKTKETLTDIQERIFTMELLHRKLYESKDLNSISFRKYILELSLDVNKTYGKSKNIKINTKIDDFNMNIEYALPCGLIITECITNAYKYAFLDDNGNINIYFSCIDNRCTLVIHDDGVGLPSKIDINRSKTLGLKLISTIIRGQLFGEFNYSYEEGAKFIISFEYRV